MKQLIFLLLLSPFITQAQSVVITIQADTVCNGSFVHFKATATGVTVPHYHWFTNNVACGTDSTGYTTNTLASGDSTSCEITNLAGDTIWATSNKIGMTIEHMPVVSPIIGVDSIVCVGTTISLTNNTAGGLWGITNSHYATDTNGLILGISGIPYEYGTSVALDTVIYFVLNSCGADTSYKTISIIPRPYAGFYLEGNTVCAGSYISFDESPSGAMYSAYGFTSPNAVAIYGINAGNDYVYCVDSNYCGSDTSGQSVTVIANPNKNAILPPNTVLCSGDTIALHVPFSNSYNITWTYRHMISDINEITNVLKAVDAGTDTIHLEGDNVCGYFYNTAIVTVLPPGHIATYDSFCIGTSVLVIDSTPGGNWSVTDPDIATIDATGMLHPVSLGVVTIRYSLSSCTATKIIKVKPPIANITGDTTLCLGGTLLLKDTTLGGAWISTDSNTAIVDTLGNVTSLSQGSATISYQVGGCVSTTLMPIKKSDLITKANKIYNICAGTATTLTTGNDFRGNWVTSDTNIHLVVNSVKSVRAAFEGYATVLFTTDEGCYDSLLVIVTNCDKKIAVFPDPAKNEITIQADNFYFFTFTFMNTAGQVLLKQDITSMFTRVNIETLPPGFYLINFYGYNSKQQTVKFRKD